MDHLDPQLAAALSQFGQEHLLAFWNELTPPQRAALAADIQTVDFELVRRLHQHGEAAQDWATMAAKAVGPTAFRCDGRGNRFSPEQARQRGLAALGQVAVVLMAGGQGTRLGFDLPKGMYPIGPISGHSLFQILLEKILATGRRHGVSIPLLVMTSPATHDTTAQFLAEHHYFGLDAADVTLFCQGTMPAADAATGRLLLAEKHRLALSPDGTGGIVAAMQRHDVLEKMQSRGIRRLFYMQVDNPLVSVCDVEFLGYHVLAGSEVSTLVVSKTSPLEPLGNVVSIDGQVRILEYSDLSRVAKDRPEIAQRRQPDGVSVFWAGNLGIHVLELAFLERVAAAGSAAPLSTDAVAEALPFHIARKKVPHIDVVTGRNVAPERENAVKFERFVFDMLPAARQAIVVEVDRRTHFAPLKNAPGAATDTPEAVQAQVLSVHREWLRAAGAQVADDVRVEVGPLWALDREQAQKRLGSDAEFSHGVEFDRDRYLGPGSGTR